MYPDYISAKKMRENYEGNVFSCMGCRSFLSPWKDENDNYKFEGRFNQGVVSLNLPQIAILAKGDEKKFWSLLDERLKLCFEALMCRHEALLGTISDISPIHWQHGAISRLKKGETIDKLLYGGYSSISLGYIGIYETTKLMRGVSHTTPEGEEFALKLMNKLRETTDMWKKETNIGFALYGTPAESLCYRFAKIDKERFGTIEDVTDKGYYTNSYHVDVREDIDAFSKFKFESQFQPISSGGAISYVEIPNMRHNLEAIEEIIKFIYNNIQYAEFNTKSDYCYECGFDGEMTLNKDLNWECPCCKNNNQKKMNIVRRVCGYLGGDNQFNYGKKLEINSRKLHI
jgi:ribonucleoside-triphosphate reductase